MNRGSCFLDHFASRVASAQGMLPWRAESFSSMLRCRNRTFVSSPVGVGDWLRSQNVGGPASINALCARAVARMKTRKPLALERMNNGDASGQVRSLNSSGVDTLVAGLGATAVYGMHIAPATFGSLGGDLIVMLANGLVSAID